MTTVHGAEVFANGIDAVTGAYLVPPMAHAAAAAMIRGETTDDKAVGFLKRVWTAFSKAHLGLPFGIDPTDVTKAGWALVVHGAEATDVKAALEPLVEHRRRQVADDARVKVLEYRPPETRAQWLARHKIGAGTVDPTRVPFYLLLCGGPSQIPFSFGRELAMEYAVGVLHFDTAAEYAQYVASVLAYERGDAPPRAKRVTYFAPRHAFDAATQMSADQLVRPLATGDDASPAVAERFGYRSESWWGSQAMKEALLDVLARDAAAERPAFVFTASHGIGLPLGHTAQRVAQGALLCQDWKGLGSGPVDPSHYLAASDVPDSARVHGLVSFHFACFGAGTPDRDRFAHKPGVAPPQIADEPFYAALPKRLLAHPGGGAIGCVGHVERAWGHSIVTAGAGAQLQPFANAISRILSGQPLGLALKDFNERFAALSVSLSGMLEQVGFGASIPDAQLVSAWIQRNDAEGFVLLGDPAARIDVEELV